MPFPDSPRVIYARNPLNEVICQIRFPPILRINAEQPSAFQERVRARYPLFREVQPELPTGDIPPEFATALRAMVPHGFEFASEDGVWAITLSRDFLAIRTTKYHQWEEFRDEHLAEPLSSLKEIYKPAFFVRVGLRYVDVLQRSTLDLADRSWAELLRPEIAGEFGAREIATGIKHAKRELCVKLTGDGEVMIRHGTVLLAEDKNKEQCFAIDSDFFAEPRVEPQRVTELLNDFNRKSGRLFRWCIQDSLHRAMGPATVGG